MNMTMKRRRENSLCVWCGLCDDRTAAGRYLCELCKQKKTRWRQEHDKKLKAEHRCIICQAPMPKDWFYVSCEKCKTRDRNNYYKRKKTAEAATPNGQHKKIS